MRSSLEKQKVKDMFKEKVRRNRNGTLQDRNPKQLSPKHLKTRHLKAAYQFQKKQEETAN